LLSAKMMSCVPALLSPTGGSRLLVVAVPEGRPNTQRALSGRPRTDQAIAKSFSFLARLELGEDLPCLTVDDDECLQGAEPLGDPRHDGWAVCPMLTERERNTVGSGAIERACRSSAKTRQLPEAPVLGRVRVTVTDTTSTG
jgi:hypothetical protein